MRVFFLSVALTACGGESTLAACETKGEPDLVESCLYERALPLLARPDLLSPELENIKDDGMHDLLVLRLGMARPDLIGALCARARHPSTRDKCKLLENRPHLSADAPITPR